MKTDEATDSPVFERDDKLIDLPTDTVERLATDVPTLAELLEGDAIHQHEDTEIPKETSVPS